MPPRNPVLQRALEGKNNRVGPVAEATGLSEFTIWRGVREGKIPAVRHGRAVLLPPEATLRLFGHEASAA